MVDPSAADQYLIEFPKSIRHKRDALVGLGSDGTTGEARLRSGEALPFDYAVLALGSSYAPFKPGDAPLSKGQRKAAFQALHERLEAAGSVLVVGGGYVGVELAAQVACHFRGRRKHLTLLAGPVPRLLSRMEPRAGEYALNFLQQQGVEVVLGESITDWGGLSADVPAASSVTLRTDRGRRLQADLAIRAVGPRPATAVLAGSLAPEQLAPSGAVRVGPTLQVAGLPNVLAIGDCADLPREATANFADIEGAVAAHNIKALAARRSGGSGKRPRLQTYPVGLLGGRAPYVGGSPRRRAMSGGLRNFIHSTYKQAAEAVLKPRSQSAFKEKGVLTPEEFVAAGDYLVNTCGTWAWEAGDPKKAWPFLPPAKQFLITRNVPCLRRAAAVEEYGEAEEMEVEAGEGGEGEGWLTADPTKQAAPITTTNVDGFEEIPSIGGGGAEGVEEVGGGGAAEEEGEEEVPDIADLEIEDSEGEADEAALPQAAAGGGGADDDHIVRTRTYDLLISYDKFYQVPHFWLVGYDENRHPLTHSQVLEDVSQDHARKTVTMEPHPHGPPSACAASIHPCRHAEVMHKLSEVVAGEQAEFKVEHYMVLFLKFIASVVPTIDQNSSLGATFAKFADGSSQPESPEPQALAEALAAQAAEQKLAIQLERLGITPITTCTGAAFSVIRDDLAHPFLGGNKMRKLDGLWPQLVAAADVVTCGGLQSAHVCAVASVAAAAGKRAHLLVRGERPEVPTGHHLYARMLAHHVEYVSRAAYADRGGMLAAYVQRLQAAGAGGGSAPAAADSVAVIPEGAAEPSALLGLVRLAEWLARQPALGSSAAATLVVDSGTGATAAGLALGAALLGAEWQVVGIMLAGPLSYYQQQAAELTRAFCEQQGLAGAAALAVERRAAAALCWNERRTPRKFGKVLDGELATCRRIAQQHGIVVDPIWTLAAWEAAELLAAEQQQGQARAPGDGVPGPVLMLHTGGMLGLCGLAQRFPDQF
eukprot:scaffold10.g2469.t1